MTDDADPRDFLASRLANCLETLREGVQIIGFDWRYLYVNQAVCGHARRSRAELLGRTMMEVYPGIEQTEMYAVLRACMADRRPRELDNDFTYPDASKAHFHLRVEPCPEGIIVLSLDTTEREQLQLQLRWAQKMDAIGRLASGIAHDFNNVLSAILGLSSFALKSVGSHHPAARDLKDVLDAVERGSGLARQLLAFASSEPIAACAVDVNTAVQQLHRVLGRLIRDGVQIVLRLSDDVWPTVIDPGALDQVVLNLVLNARDALPEGGHITIESASVTFSEEAPVSGPAAAGSIPPGDYVMLAVSDDGIGMTPDVRERMFDPFFTTKPRGQGTGLGLATCYGIVRGAGGHIAVFSEPGQGTTVRIYLPRSSGVLPFVRRSPAERPLGGTETVLIVEDNAAVRAVAARALRESGYQVEVAAGPPDALAVAAGSARIDLLVSELWFPNGSGRDLALAVRRSHPAASVLYVSGHSEAATGNRGGLPPRTSLLLKPFSPSVLARKVRAVLDARSADMKATGSDDAAPAPIQHAVLVADSDEISRRMIRTQVRELGYTVLVANDHEDIVRQAVEARPAVLVLDIQSRDIDGQSVLRRLSLTGVDAGVVVTTSGDTGAEDVIAALRSGAVDCLQKPWTRDELRAAIERAAAVFEATQTV